MAFKIEKRFFSWIPNKSLNAKNYVIAHESGNAANSGPDSLEREINYMNRTKTVFVSHWVGGGGKIVQVAPTGKLQYGAGPAANPVSVAHVELARTKNKATFKKDYEAYIWLLRKIADEYGLPKTLDTGNAGKKGIKTHAWVTKFLGRTTHVDPYSYLKSFGVTKERFVRDIEKGIESNDLDKKFYTYAPDKLVTLKSVGIYSDKELTKEVKRYPKDTRLVVEKAVEDKNGVPRFKVPGGYMSANRKFVKGYHTVKGTVTVLANKLNVYDSPRWDNPTCKLKKGYTVEVKKKVVTDGYEQYMTKQGDYISAHPKYTSFKVK